MLSNSLNIKNQTENMIESYKTHDTTTFVRSLASLLKSIIDFESYTSVSGSNATSSSAESFYGYTKKVTYVAPLFERQAAIEASIEESRSRRAESIKEKNVDVNGGKVRLRQYTKAEMASRKMVELGEGYKWGARDYIQAPIGLLIGALHALPSDTNGPACSSNSTSFRQYLLEGIDYDGDTDK